MNSKYQIGDGIILNKKYSQFNNSENNINESLEDTIDESILLTSDNLPTENFINDSINSTLPYVSDNPQWDTIMTVNSCSNTIPSQRIEMLNMFLTEKEEMNETIKEIHKIHHNLIMKN